MKTKTVAIVQSSYIPWKGYFDLIHRSDEFILLDEVQYTRRDWRNRNRIKTEHGFAWLTIPLRNKGNYLATIAAMEVAGDDWREMHRAKLVQAYRRATFFDNEAEFVTSLYAECRSSKLSDINRHFLSALCKRLDIRTSLVPSSRYCVFRDDPTERLVALCQAAGATNYLSGPSARNYLDEEKFRAAGVRVDYIDYRGYPEYPQLHGNFEHSVSIFDLLFCTGPNAPRFIQPSEK